jgi:hypothetical protein
MPKSTFISYSHRQGDWVWDRLVPVLKAGGTPILIDREQFEAARAVRKQMDEVQDRAEQTLLVLSPEYLQSKACQHEMKRAVARDPDFDRGLTIPVVREACTLPASIKRPNPIYVNLKDDRAAEPWALLLRKCEADPGAPAADWLDARDRVRQHLLHGDSVNLVLGRDVRFLPLLDDLRREPDLSKLGLVDLASGIPSTRRGFVEEILHACGEPARVPEPPGDLETLERHLAQRGRSRLALAHFDMVLHRPQYDADLFVALRSLVMNPPRRLTLLVQSRTAFPELLPPEHPLVPQLSRIDLKTVELRGQP